MKLSRKKCFLVGVIVALISFALLFLGVRFILLDEILFKNIVAYIVQSVILGGIATILLLLQFKIAFTCFLSGVIIGFLYMYGAFLDGMNGWADLAGIISLFTWEIFGLAAGLIIQLIVYIYKKFKTRNRV
ncbi:MAG: hypothetical protein K0S41_104 [Anaerocolumna sp.]|jgi:hypothetical protein|nr:hypothetical protein [Anaerocolumna sp.]